MRRGDEHAIVSTTGEHPAPELERFAEARVAELERELAEAQRAVADRMRELEQKSAALEAANLELRSLTRNLDQIVRQRTRALAESEYKLRRQNLELERLSRARGDFIAIAAHELRTPLTSLVGYLDLFKEKVAPALESEPRRQLVSLHRSAHRLRRLVEDMLDLTRLETGTLTLRRGPCSLADVVTAALEELRPLSGRRTLRTELADVPLLDGDTDKLHQAVANLIVNAVKYAVEDAEVSVILERSTATTVRLRVRHEGRGIPASLRDRLFEPFTGIDGPRHHSSRGPDSAGLGLRIARGIFELHGGSLTVDSEEGRFTELTAVLPLVP
jgi:two-component system, OmpR family, phosphate regulon sensor histidine kinase PhoR